jgi:hypothetical protein
MDELNQLFHTLAPWLLGILGFGTVTAALAVAKYYLDLRQASFFILRRRTQGKLRVSLLVMIILAALTAAVYIGQDYVPEPVPGEEEVAGATTLAPSSVPSRATRREPSATPTVTPTRDATITAPFIPTNTPSITPSSTPPRTPTPPPSMTPTPSLTSSATPTPSITPTPSPTVPILEAIATPVEPFATLPAEADIQELTVSTGVQVNGTPINPGDAFLEGQPALYVSFGYDNMVNGVLWRHIWLRDGWLYGGGTVVWEWGERGRTYFYLRPEGGFVPGQYEVQMLLEEEVVQTVEFTIQ